VYAAEARKEKGKRKSIDSGSRRSEGKAENFREQTRKFQAVIVSTLRMLLAARIPVSITTANDREPSISVSAETWHKVYGGGRIIVNDF